MPSLIGLLLNIEYSLVKYYPHPLYTVDMYRDLLVSQYTETIIDWNCVLLVQLSPGLFLPLILSLWALNMVVHWPGLVLVDSVSWEGRLYHTCHTSGVHMLTMSAVHVHPVIHASQVIPVQGAGILGL